MSTVDVGAFSFPAESEAVSFEPGVLQEFEDFLKNGSCLFDLSDNVHATVAGGATTETTNEGLTQLGLNIYDVRKKYLESSIQHMAQANKVRKGRPAGVKQYSRRNADVRAQSGQAIFGMLDKSTFAADPKFASLFAALEGAGAGDSHLEVTSLSTNKTNKHSSFPDQFGLADAVNLGLAEVIPPVVVPASNAAIESLADRSGFQLETFDSKMDWSWLDDLTAMESPLAQSAGSSSGSQSTFDHFKNNGGYPSETPRSNNFLSQPVFTGESVAANTQMESTKSWAQEAAERGIPPPTLDLKHTERKMGVGRAGGSDSQRYARLDALIKKGGLLPGQHDDDLGIVRKSRGEFKIHRHTAAESKMPIDVQISFSRLRTAAYDHMYGKAPRKSDPMNCYRVPEDPKQYRCPICKRCVKGLRPFIRHVEGKYHLNIIYLGRRS